MNEAINGGKKRGLIALFLGLAMPGLGQVYNGDAIKGASIFIIFNTLVYTGLRLAVRLPDRYLMWGVLATLCATGALYIASAIFAGKNAKKSAEAGRSAYNRWYFYLALWLLGSFVFMGATYSYSAKNVVQAYKIPAATMEPAVLKGDHVLADKTAYRRMAPKKGDVVIFVYPDDRSKIFMKRIGALPGTEITLPNGKKETVPHGMIYVLGDNPGASIDSRQFGFVPLADVIGKVRQVYFSIGQNGVRWDRIGKVVGK